MNLKINHIQHIGIPVTDIKKSEAFYEKLGFVKMGEDTESSRKPGMFYQRMIRKSLF